jgi:hypothetical protein
MLCEDLSDWEVVKEVKFGRLHTCQVNSMEVEGRGGGAPASFVCICTGEEGWQLLREVCIAWMWRGFGRIGMGCVTLF